MTYNQDPLADHDTYPIVNLSQYPLHKLECIRKTRIRSSFSECVSFSYTWDIKILATSSPLLS